jgi:hypothetical protein
MEIQAPKVCEKCGAEVRELKGISSKTNKPYHFWACSNRACDFTWNPPKKEELYHEEVMEALRELYKLVLTIKEGQKKTYEE